MSRSYTPLTPSTSMACNGTALLVLHCDICNKLDGLEDYVFQPLSGLKVHIKMCIFQKVINSHYSEKL
jgi:hypothetical protein